MNKSLAAIDSLVAEIERVPDKLPRNVRAKSTAAGAAGTTATIKDGLVTACTTIFDTAVRAAFPMAAEKGFKGVSVMRCVDAKFGDLQCNSAMGLFKMLKQNGVAVAKPQDVAKAIMENVPANNIVGKMSIAGAGFINITVAPDVVLNSTVDIARNGATAPSINAKKLKVVVDFSSPNIAKEMHVGHLRSTIIGDTLCRVLEFCECEVMRVNHVGDWGTQFGMLIQYLKDAYPDWQKTPPNLTELTTFYKAAKQKFDEDEEFKAKARLNVPKLQKGDPECRQIWKMLCDISRVEFKKVYDRLGVKLEEFGESYYNEMIPRVLQELEKQITPQEGAQCIFRDNWSCPLIVRKSDGGFGYDSTDMAALNYRLKELKVDWAIYITDAGQQRHFHMCFDAARDAGWVKEGVKLDHVGFGVVCGDDGKRFKTRSSETVRLIDLLNASKERMKASLELRVAEGKCALQAEALDSAAACIGFGAVKYFDLKQHPSTNYIFSYDRMLDTKGDTAVYLLFAYARIMSILRKAAEERDIDVQDRSKAATVSLEHPSERALAFELMQFGDMLEVVVRELLPNRLCDYLKEVATKCTDFVTKCHVLNAEDEGLVLSRLYLCTAAQKIMLKCFELLGIKALDRI